RAAHGGTHLAVQESQERALARAVRARDEPALTRVELPVAAVQHPSVAEPDVPAAHVEQPRGGIVAVRARASGGNLMATRFPAKFDANLAAWLSYGASPRGSIALDRCARAHAWLAGRDFVSPEDIQAVFFDVLRHRIILSFEA